MSRPGKGAGRYWRLMGSLWRNQKAMRAGDAALGLLVRVWSYCADSGAGFISHEAMRMLLATDAKHGKRKLEKLIAVGLLDVVEGGYCPHDAEEHNPILRRLQEPVELPGRPANDGEDIVTDRSDGADDGAVRGQVGGRCPEQKQGFNPPSSDPRPKTHLPSEEEKRAKLAADAPRVVETEAPPGAEIAALEARYGQPELLADVRAGCALSRRNGRMADSVWLATLRQLDRLPLAAVLPALRLFDERYANGDRDERYLLGIARNQAKRGVLHELRPTRPQAPDSLPSFADVTPIASPSTYFSDRRKRIEAAAARA